MRPFSPSLPLALLILAAAGAPAPAAPARRVAIRASADVPRTGLDRLAAAARARGVEVDLSAESAAVPPGFDLLRLSTLPPSDTVRAAVLVFPVAFQSGAFVFDGRAYRQRDEAVRLTASTGGEIIVLGNSATAVLSLAGRWLSAPPASDYEVLSGDLTRAGRFERRDGRLVVDRGSDRDRIAEREAFLAALKRRTRGVVVWEFPEGSAEAAAKWEKTASRFVRKGKLVVRVYPDTVTKAALTGSARPADLSGEADALRVDLDAAAPAEPDLVTPVLAAAGLAAADPSLLSRPALLAAAGARRAGRWWGRDVKTFAAFTRAAAVDPSIEDVLATADSLSPVLDVGTAASWLDAGARLESEAAVEKSLGKPDAVLVPLLARWRAGALRQTVAPPKRRPLPATFLRGVSYAAPDELEDSLVSARSREALGRLAAAGFTSIALRPAALMRDPQTAEILFVRRGARGETDEGLVRAVGDAHAAGMTAMVAPELLVGGGMPAGRVAMPGETAWAEWFFAYRRFLVHEAVVAEAAGADLFAVGVALTSTEEQKNEWKHVIAAARLATGASLLYAAAGAAGAAEVPFWSSLDAIGVQFLEPLARSEKVADATLTEGARAAARPLAELSKRTSKPVVFAQAGYPLVRAAWTTPADGGGRPAAPEDAARAIGAVFRALASEDWWRGVYWPQADAGSPAAEKAILDGFRALEAAAPVSALLDAAVDAAVEGGRVLLPNWRNLPHGSVEEKQKNDFVTQADRESERRIIGVLQGRFPGDAFLAEEGGASGGAAAGARVWIIDPLDGTSNFVSGFPFWCVSIAAREGDELVAAVVWDPLREEMYTAEPGGGAWRNGTRLSVTGRADLEGAFVATGFPFRNRHKIDSYLALFKAVFVHARAIRRAGSAALDLAYVAAGVFDGFFEFRLAPWDVAAGALLIEEAGGVLTDFDGGKRYLERGNVVAGPRGVADGIRRAASGIVTEDTI